MFLKASGHGVRKRRASRTRLPPYPYRKAVDVGIGWVIMSSLRTVPMTVPKTHWLGKLGVEKNQMPSLASTRVPKRELRFVRRPDAHGLKTMATDG